MGSGQQRLITELRSNNARLRALIKAAEAVNSGRCPWCASQRRANSLRDVEPHALRSDAVPHPDLAHADCPAFTPEGEVR